MKRVLQRSGILPRPSYSSLVLESRTKFRERARGTSTRRKRTSAFTLIELLTAVTVIGVFVSLAVPAITDQAVGGDAMSRTLSNARQLHLATQTMTLDTFQQGGHGLEWTSMMAAGKPTPATVAQYFDALVKNGYLTADDLKKLVTAPGRGPGAADPSVANSCFKFFAVDDGSPSDQPLLITANWSDRKLTTDTPYGMTGFVEFSKGGSGGIYRRGGDASSTDLFPAGKDAKGQAYSYEVLK